MARELLKFVFVTIFNPNPVDINIFWLALLRVNRFNFLLELSEGLVVFPETVIHVTSYSMTVSGISSVIIAFLAFFVFVDIVKRLL